MPAAASRWCAGRFVYLWGWTAYFRRAKTLGALAEIEGWVRLRLWAVELKHWK
jgi:hypothetical protein